MLLRMKNIGLLQGLSMRLEATHIHISGRLHLGVQLTHEPPGIKGISYVSLRNSRMEALGPVEYHPGVLHVRCPHNTFHLVIACLPCYWLAAFPR